MLQVTRAYLRRSHGQRLLLAAQQRCCLQQRQFGNTCADRADNGCVKQNCNDVHWGKLTPLFDVQGVHAPYTLARTSPSAPKGPFSLPMASPQQLQQQLEAAGHSRYDITCAAPALTSAVRTTLWATTCTAELIELVQTLQSWAGSSRHRGHHCQMAKSAAAVAAGAAAGSTYPSHCANACFRQSNSRYPPPPPRNGMQQQSRSQSSNMRGGCQHPIMNLLASSE